MRSILNLAVVLVTVFTLSSCSSTNSRSVATDDQATQHEYKQGKRLINETNY